MTKSLFIGGPVNGETIDIADHANQTFLLDAKRVQHKYVRRILPVDDSEFSFFALDGMKDAEIRALVAPFLPEGRTAH